MNEIIRNIQKEQIDSVKKSFPDFKIGDTIKVTFRLEVSGSSKIQNIEGVVISKTNKGVSSRFTVRRIAFGEGIEHSFLTYSTLLQNITILKKGIVRRAKLYYLRGLTGKAAKIKEDLYSKKT